MPGQTGGRRKSLVWWLNGAQPSVLSTLANSNESGLYPCHKTTKDSRHLKPQSAHSTLGNPRLSFYGKRLTGNLWAMRGSKTLDTMKNTYKVTSTVETFGTDCARWVASVCKAQAAGQQAFLVHGFRSCVLHGLQADGGNLTLSTSGKGDKLSLNLNKSDVFKVAAVSPLERQFALMVKLTELNLEFGTNVQMPILPGVRLEKREKK